MESRLAEIIPFNSLFDYIVVAELRSCGAIFHVYQLFSSACPSALIFSVFTRGYHRSSNAEFQAKSATSFIRQDAHLTKIKLRRMAR
jgi:hypothetical protein